MRSLGGGVGAGETSREVAGDALVSLQFHIYLLRNEALLQT